MQRFYFVVLLEVREELVKVKRAVKDAAKAADSRLFQSVDLRTKGLTSKKETVLERAVRAAVANADFVLASPTLREGYKAWLLSRWHGLADRPDQAEVIMLSSRELRTYDPGELFFVGESGGSGAAWCRWAEASTETSMLPLRMLSRARALRIEVW